MPFFGEEGLSNVRKIGKFVKKKNNSQIFLNDEGKISFALSLLWEHNHFVISYIFISDTLYFYYSVEINNFHLY